MAESRPATIGASAAELYEEILVPGIYNTWARFVVDAANPKRGDRALDIACGTGVVTRLLAQRVSVMGEVIGLDIDPAMLAVARNVPRPSGSAAIDWDEGSATLLPYEDEHFDIVTCQQGLPFITNRATAMTEMYRVLGLSGRVSMLVWRAIEHNPGFAAFADVIERYAGADAAATIRAQFIMDNAEELRSLFRNAHFRDIKIDSTTGTAFFPSVEVFTKSQILGTPLARALANLGPEARATLYPDICVALTPYTTPQGVMFPMAAHLISAKK
jgi:ubiquinone/menaquinone biosynthesis C-methylase UbiE